MLANLGAFIIALFVGLGIWFLISAGETIGWQ
jgi:hypothetical protein